MRPKLKHVRYVETKGKVYAYFNTGKKLNGKPVYAPLPPPSSGSFFQSYGTMKANRDRKADAVYTFASMADEYQSSDAFAALADGTRKAYRTMLRPAVDLLGHFPVNALNRAAIQAIFDKRDWGAGKRNLFVAVIGAVYRWGRKRDKTDAHPTRDMGKAETGERQAWPDSALEAGLAAEGRVGLAIALLLYTGQRIGDVCAMRWSDIKDGSIKLVQQKTKKPLTIRLHSDLNAALARHGKRGVTLLTGENGKPVGPQTIRDEIKAFVAERGHAGLLPHGLRKNAVIALLTHQCSVAETAAITGQTYQLVEYYARQIDQERMAGAAILKWEQNAPMKTPAKTGTQGIEN